MRWFFTMVLLFVIAAPLCAQPATSQVAVPLAEIVKRLSSDDFATRQAAQRDLNTIPATQIESLRKLTTSNIDPEAKAILLERIDEMEVYIALHPPPLSISARNVELNTILTSMNKQMDIPFFASMVVSDVHFTLEAQNQPLWPVLAKLSQNRPLSFWRGDHMIGMGFENDPSSFGSPLVIPITSTNWTLDALDGFAVSTRLSPISDREPRQKSTTLVLILIPDPRIRISRFNTKLKPTLIRDNLGNDLIIDVAQAGGLQRPARTDPTIFFSTSVATPPNLGNSIALFKSTLEITLAMQVETAVIKDIDQKLHQKLPVANGIISITQGVRANNGLFPYEIAFDQPPNSLDVSMFAVVRDETGEIVVSRTLPGRSQDLGDRGVIVLPFKFNHPNLPVGYSLELIWHPKTRTIKLPIELKNIPFPER